MKPRTVLSLEQALSLPYATLRFVHLGWRVIRIEPTPQGAGLPGDPNRYIGSTAAGEDRRSYFLAPNVGKEAIALNLKERAGREILYKLINRLNVDVFCCNTLPARYRPLGIDYATLKSIEPDIIWAGISAMGPDYPDVPGYDPAMQAMAGFMELTGAEDGPPTLSGIPVIDLKAGDEIYAGVCLALAERAETGRGAEIHVSMLQAAASWLITTLPLVDFDCEDWEITRSGNKHRKFIPTNAYPTRDGFIYLAIGSDLQWKRLIGLPRFAGIASETRMTNSGRLEERQDCYRDIAAITAACSTRELAEEFDRAKLPHAVINTVRQVRALEALAPKLTVTRLPDGRLVRMQPMPVNTRPGVGELPLPPKYGEHTRAVLAEAGYSEREIENFAGRGLIAGLPVQVVD